MARLELTAELIRSAGLDAGNRSMRAGNRTKWNQDDQAAATEEYNRLNRILDTLIAQQMNRDLGPKP